VSSAGKWEEQASDRERLAARGLAIAFAFLRRWDDPATNSLRDDYAQEAVIAALARLPAMRAPERFPALVRTIARRVRSREMRLRIRQRFAGLPSWHDSGPEESHFEIALRIRGSLGERVRVEDRCVEKQWLLDALDSVLERLPALNRRILRGYYEGFSCRELAERYGLAEDNVKVRLHRGRKRVRKELVREVRQTQEA